MQPAPDEVRPHLDRILASEPFANADRLSRFLRYVVERALAGEGDRLKEYVIGTDVFDKGERYDPRLDSIVRVEAGRLRAKLDEYYSHQGSNDSVVIRIPRGSYAPTFELRHTAVDGTTGVGKKIAAAVAAALLVTGIIAWGASRRAPTQARTADISVAVLPFRTYSTEESVRLLAARITDGVTSELVRLGTVDVVSHTSALQFGERQRPMSEIAQALGADVVMEGSLAADGARVQIEVRLVDAALDRKFWVERFTGDVSDIDGLQRRMASAAAAAATRPRR